MSTENYAERFTEIKPKYKKLGLNVQQALETLLDEQKISYLSINHRIKEQDSFLKKIKLKAYKDPFKQTEDICGFRIICYFQNDIEKIQNIINTEFSVSENQIKEDLLNVTEFGYRSTHLIAQIKKEWASIPTYRGLDDLKFEIQIRTILMHSWAEIEHKLAYKAESDIPKELRRKFSFISAILEAGDIQFEEIKDRIYENKKKIIKEAEENQKFDDSLELNLDNLQAFMDFAFKDHKKDIYQTQYLLKELHDFKISFPDLINGFNKYKSELPKIEKEDMEKLSPSEKEHIFGNADAKSSTLWAQSGAIRVLMMLISKEYRNLPLFQPKMQFLNKYLIND